MGVTLQQTYRGYRGNQRNQRFSGMARIPVKRRCPNRPCLSGLSYVWRPGTLWDQWCPGLMRMLGPMATADGNLSTSMAKVATNCFWFEHQNWKYWELSQNIRISCFFGSRKLIKFTTTGGAPKLCLLLYTPPFRYTCYKP